MTIYYIAGPMRNKPNYNRHEFNRIEHYLREKGHLVLNPARHAIGLDIDYYLSIARIDIDHCDAVYFLPGWEQSEGARIERDYAERIGKICCFNGFEVNV